MIFFSIVLLTHYTIVSFALICVGLFRDFAAASLVGNLVFTVQTYSCGFFAQIYNLPVYVRWLRWTCFLVRSHSLLEVSWRSLTSLKFYAYTSLNANEFEGQSYNCPESGGEVNPACLQYSGDFQLSEMGIPPNWIWRPIAALVGFASGFFILSWLILFVHQQESQIISRQPPEEPGADHIEIDFDQNFEEVSHSTVISLDKYAIDIDKRMAWEIRSQTVTLLKPLSIHFEPGGLNVIM